MVHHRPHKLEIRQGSITKLMVSSATDQVWAMKWQKCVPSCQFITLRREVVRLLVFCRQFSLYVRCGCDFLNSVKPQFFTFWRQNRSSAVKPYHRAFNLTIVGTFKERLSERVTRKIVVSEPFRSEISPAYLMSLEVFHFFPSSDICSYKSRVSVQVNTWHWTLFSTFTKYPACSKTTHSIIHFYFPEVLFITVHYCERAI